MSKLLATVHTNCGEKPQIGRVFQFTGTNSVGVFFTVTDHPEGNLPLAGMVIATATGSNQVQAAMVYDLASRFGQTANPLLQQLFSAWNPGAATGAGPVSASAPAGNGAGLPPMRQVSLADGTATLSLPTGWNVVANQSAMGQTTVSGPQGELLGLNYGYNAEDLNNPSVQNMLRRGLKFQNTVYYPSNADLTKSFADLVQQIRAAVGQGPAPMKVDSVQAPSGSQGQCVSATGQLNPDGAGMRQMEMLLCRSTPNQQTGMYTLTLTKCLLPLGATDQQRTTANAIMASYKPDMQRAQAIANAQSAPIIAQMQQTYQAHQQALMSFTQQQIANIHQIGANATARYNATQAANSAEQSSWEASQDANARNSAGFSNYLLDQTVVQNNYTGAHATQWNSAADAMVKANPNKYSYVNTPNYIPGTDY